MIELLRAWHHTWNPYIDGLVSIILFLGGYTAVMLTIAIASYKIGERKRQKMQRNYCFPIVLKKLMKERKTNMRRLADATGIGESTISDWIHRDISPSAVSLMTLSDYFNVSIDYLLFGEEFKK